MDYLKLTTDGFDAINDPATKLKAWNAISEEAARLKAMEAHARTQMFGVYFPAATEGTNNFELGNGYILKAVKKLSYTLAKDDKLDDAITAIEKLGERGKFLSERLFKFTPELAVGEYKKLESTNKIDVKIKALVDDVLTIKDGMPTLEIVAPK